MATTHRRSLLAVGLLLLVVAAGCSGGGLLGSGGGDAGGGASDGARATGSEAGGADGSSGGLASAPLNGRDVGRGSDDLPVLRARQVVFTGHVVLEVDDVDAARRNLTAAVRERGGYVSDARAQLRRVDEQPSRSGTIVLRVPRENFSATMDRVEAGGTVLSTDTSSEDVTDQLVDVEARLASLRDERDRLRTLYGRANETEAVLAVERRLASVQTDIERLAARQQSIQRRVAYSTITVELHEERPAAQPERWYDVGAVGAFLESVDGVVVTLRALSVALAYALPYLLVFGAPVVAIGVALRRRRSDA